MTELIVTAIVIAVVVFALIKLRSGSRSQVIENPVRRGAGGKVGRAGDSADEEEGENGHAR